MTFRHNKIGAGHFTATKSTQKKNELTLLFSAFIKKKIVCEVNSFAFNGNSLHSEHECIFALPLHLSVNHYYKQVISSITIKYCITVIAMQRSPAVSTHSLVLFGSCGNKLHHYKRSRDMQCITPGIVQCRLCENATLLAIKQLRKIIFY